MRCVNSTILSDGGMTAFGSLAGTTLFGNKLKERARCVSRLYLFKTPTEILAGWGIICKLEAWIKKN